MITCVKPLKVPTIEATSKFTCRDTSNSFDGNVELTLRFLCQTKHCNTVTPKVRCRQNSFTHTLRDRKDLSRLDFLLPVTLESNFCFVLEFNDFDICVCWE